MTDQIKLGQHVRDIMTGFEGYVAQRVEHLSSVQYSVQPKCKPDSTELPSALNFDVGMLEVLGTGISDRAVEPTEHAFNLGDRLRDTATGFEGIAIGRVTFTAGCVYYRVAGPVDPKKPHINPSPEFIDGARLERVVTAAEPERQREDKRVGGPIEVSFQR